MKSSVILVIVSIIVHATSLSVKVTHSQNLEPTSIPETIYTVGSSVISLEPYRPLRILKRDPNGVQSTHVFNSYGMACWPVGFAVGDSFNVITAHPLNNNQSKIIEIDVPSMTVKREVALSKFFFSGLKFTFVFSWYYKCIRYLYYTWSSIRWVCLFVLLCW